MIGPDERPAARYVFVLASSSPARLATLRAAGFDPYVLPSGIDESAITAASTYTLVQKLAAAKAQAVAAHVPGDAVVLGCDSMLEFDGEPLGKPGTVQEAVTRWRRMRGKKGTLYTGHEVIDVPRRQTRRAVVATDVWFADVTDDEIRAYAYSGEPANVAGAFTIDGFGGWFIERVDGDHHNVVGVSLPVLRDLLRDLGLELVDFGWPVPEPQAWLDVPGQPPP